MLKFCFNLWQNVLWTKYFKGIWNGNQVINCLNSKPCSCQTGLSCPKVTNPKVAIMCGPQFSRTVYGVATYLVPQTKVSSLEGDSSNVEGATYCSPKHISINTRSAHLYWLSYYYQTQLWNTTWTFVCCIFDRSIGCYLIN